MLKALEIGEPKYRLSYLTAQNKELPMFALSKSLTMALMAKYDYKAGYAMACKIEELERQLELVSAHKIKATLERLEANNSILKLESRNANVNLDIARSKRATELEIINSKLDQGRANLVHSIEVAKILGRSFDVNEYLKDRDLSEQEKQVLIDVSKEAGGVLKELSGIDLEHSTMTFLLEKHSVQMHPFDFNSRLEALEILSGRTVTTKGKRFGFNWRAGPNSYRPRWYVSRLKSYIGIVNRPALPPAT